MTDQTNNTVENNNATPTPVVDTSPVVQEPVEVSSTTDLVQQAGAQVQDAVNQVQAQAQQFAGTVQEVAKDPTKVV